MRPLATTLLAAITLLIGVPLAGATTPAPVVPVVQIPGLTTPPFVTMSITWQDESCSDAASCTAVGVATDASGALIAVATTMTNGSWASTVEIGQLTAPQIVPPTTRASPPAGFSTVTCPTGSTCIAGGWMTSASGQREAMVTSVVNGTWGAIAAVAPPSGDAIEQASQWTKASIDATACSSPTTCIATGTALVAPSQALVFVASWSNGAWSNAQVVSGLPTDPSITVSTATCSEGGACAVGGTYVQGSTRGVYVAASSGGVWGTGLATDRVPGGTGGGSVVLSGLTCGGISTCVASGTFIDAAISVQPFVAVATSGVWSPPERLPGVDRLNVGATRYNDGGVLRELRCFDDGSCVAVGTAMDAGGTAHVFSATFSGGTWEPAVAIAELDGNAPQGANPVDLECSSATSCALLVATYSALGVEGVATDTMVDGVWGTITPVAGVTENDVGSNGAIPEALSCPQSDACTAIMVATDANASTTLLVAPVATDAAAVASPLDLSPGVDPGLNALRLSCDALTDCTVVAAPPFPSLGRGSVIEQRDGVWGAPVRTTGLAPVIRALSHVMGNPQLLSCATPTSCVVAGEIVDASGTLQGFVATIDHGVAAPAIILARATGVNAGATLTTGFSATALACPQSGQCVLAGTTVSRSGQPAAAVAVQLPSGWSVLQAPSGLTSGWSSVVDGLSCGAPTRCTALLAMTAPSGQVSLGTVSILGGMIGSVHLLAADPNASVIGQHVDVVAWQCSANRCIGAGTWDRTNAVATSFAMTLTGTKAATKADMGTTNFSVRSMATAMACATPQRCVIAGNYEDVAGLTQSFVTGFANGRWGPAQPVPGWQTLNAGAHGTLGASIDALACPAPGHCLILGTAIDRFGQRQVVLDRTGGGGWGRAQVLHGTQAHNSGGQAQVLGLSCAAASTCAGLVAGVDHGGTSVAVIPLTTAVTLAPVIAASWTDASTVVVPTASTVLCRPQGDCSVLVTTRSGGGSTQGFVADLSGTALRSVRPLRPVDAQAGGVLATASSQVGGEIVGSMATAAGIVPWLARY